MSLSFIEKENIISSRPRSSDEQQYLDRLTKKKEVETQQVESEAKEERKGKALLS